MIKKFLLLIPLLSGISFALDLNEYEAISTLSNLWPGLISLLLISILFISFFVRKFEDILGIIVFLVGIFFFIPETAGLGMTFIIKHIWEVILLFTGFIVISYTSKNVYREKIDGLNKIKNEIIELKNSTSERIASLDEKISKSTSYNSNWLKKIHDVNAETSEQAKNMKRILQQISSKIEELKQLTKDVKYKLNGYAE